MELTNILGQAFLVNVDSVVLAYARGSDATLLLSKGNVLQDVQESVAEVVTASDGGLTAFTATSGDYTGDIAVNPNYIITVTSADSGDSSTLVIGDNTATRATVTVDIDYADMDAIIEAAGGGGGTLTVIEKDDDFTVNGASGTVYVNTDTENDITATLEDSPVGTQYTFVKEFTQGSNVRVVPAASNFIVFYSDIATASQTVPGDGDWVEGNESHATFTIIKISATHWTVISDNGFVNANEA